MIEVQFYSNTLLAFFLILRDCAAFSLIISFHCKLLSSHWLAWLFDLLKALDSIELLSFSLQAMNFRLKVFEFFVCKFLTIEYS